MPLGDSVTKSILKMVRRLSSHWYHHIYAVFLFTSLSPSSIYLLSFIVLVYIKFIHSNNVKYLMS